MKEEENIAQQYLYTISNDVVHWPDGRNVPPDFKLKQIIGVEVRRLNQNILRGDKSYAIEQDRNRLVNALSAIFNEFDSSNSVHNYWVALRFSRPVGKMADLKNRARAVLKDFLKYELSTPREIKLAKHVSIEIEKHNNKNDEVFSFVYEADLDGGGFVVPLYINNINLCIAEKTQKIQKYKSNYSEWWLVLVNFLEAGIGRQAKITVCQNIKRGNDWKKIIVISRDTKKAILTFS
jgi:hypothetical protein